MLATDTIQITADLLELLSEIDESKVPAGARAIAPDRLNALRPGRHIESIGSSTPSREARLSDREV